MRGRVLGLNHNKNAHRGAIRPVLRLDVLIPTLNRAALLEGALKSLLTAPIPPGLHVFVTVVNNGCTDATAELVEALSEQYPERLRMVCELRRGKSRALNAGIAATDAELVGMIDDDEEIGPRWYEEVYRAFSDTTLDFIGGPYVARWAAAPPSWIPKEYLAVLGSAENGQEPQDYGDDFPGILKGGNAVIRRSMLKKVGTYAEHLGPGGHARLFSCEDEEMYNRLLKAGARGRYLPSLFIYHHVSAARLTPEYYRRWCLWRGVSRGLIDRSYQLKVPYLAGVPRFLYGRAARGVGRLTARKVRGGCWEQTFTDELSVWDLVGFVLGRHIYPLARFSPVRSRRKLPRSPS